MSLAEHAEQRKQRLQKMREMAQKRPADSIKFKSYTPDTEELQKLIVKAPEIGPNAENTVEKRAREIEQSKEETKQELDLENLKPMKANWDLKRDLEKKMNRLDKLTEVAMADLIRKRLKEQGDLTGLANAADHARLAHIQDEQD